MHTRTPTTHTRPMKVNEIEFAFFKLISVGIGHFHGGGGHSPKEQGGSRGDGIQSPLFCPAGAPGPLGPETPGLPPSQFLLNSGWNCFHGGRFGCFPRYVATSVKWRMAGASSWQVGARAGRRHRLPNLRPER